MAKYGYRCQCGWILKRLKRTRKEYASAKVLHASGKDGQGGCEFLKKELAQSHLVQAGIRSSVR